LVSANRALGTGDLSARAPVMGHDELGELATGFNEMAVRLQANVETLELRVEERTEEIRRLLRERTEFFAGLSHEFRTPLAIIRNQADLVAEDATDSSMADAGRVMSTSAEQLLELVNDILDTARAEVSSVDVELEPVRLSDVVNGLKPNLADLAQSAGLRLSTKVPANLPTVYADPTRLREVVLNLVDNAVKYTPDGGKVDVTAAAVNGHVELAVRDTGVGIPLEARDRMFQPFYRVRGTRTQRGQSSSGLGLALTKRLVEAQGGSIDFTSAPGEGSTFVVKLRPVSDERGVRS
jgi:signal transduction histidine kinase